MAIKGGYFFRILNVDLTTGETSVARYQEEFAREFVGGRGLGAKLVWDNLRRAGKMDPLSPENLFVIAPGPLTGTYMPASGKNSFISISPATGIFADSSMGGGFGVELRQTGYDAVAIRGRAPQLSLLVIDGDSVKVIPGPELKGKSCLETEGSVREKLGDQSVKVATIGIAGENRVRFATINSDWSRNAGRTGMGGHPRLQERQSHSGERGKGPACFRPGTAAGAGGESQHDPARSPLLSLLAAAGIDVRH